jgi:hypothetical protein
VQEAGEGGVIHYHGTPVGGRRQDAAQFLLGRHALVPFSYPEDIAVVAEACQSFVLDNGAFTAWTKGLSVDFEAYVKWVRQWHRHPGFDWALIPDVIDGDESQNDALLDDWPADWAGVPVWHLHESLGRLERLSFAYKTVALGSSGRWHTPGTASWWTRMNQAMQSVCDDGKPRCKLHGLRMLDPDIFSRLPLSSADSTNASVNSGSLSRFGSYLPPTAAQRAAVIAARIESFNSAPTFTPVIQGELCLL